MVAIARNSPALFVVIAILCAAPAHAQMAAKNPYASLFLREVDVAAAGPGARLAIAAAASAAWTALPSSPSEKAVDKTPRWVRPALYGGLVTLQALDAHSTFRAIDAGHGETNPLMQWTVEHPLALVSIKAAATAATVLVAEKIRKRYPKRALVFMAAVNAAYAAIVIHNYRVPVQ